MAKNKKYIMKVETITRKAEWSLLPLFVINFKSKAITLAILCFGMRISFKTNTKWM
mgnify:CR=1 FL=1